MHHVPKMVTLSQAKNLGGIGSILVLLSVAPVVGWVLGIVGFILVLIAVKYISDVFQDASIFNNILIAVILAIVGTVVGGIVVYASVLRFMGLSGITFGTTNATTPSAIVPHIGGLIVGIILGLVLIWILYIVAAYFLRKTYSVVATRLNISMFSTAALLYFIGAILVIILVGFIIIFVAEILFVVAFFSIQETAATPTVAMGSPTTPPPPSQSPMPPGTSAPATTQPGKFCVKCGASLPHDVSYCPACGAMQPAI